MKINEKFKVNGITHWWDIKGTLVQDLRCFNDTISSERKRELADAAYGYILDEAVGTDLAKLHKIDDDEILE